MKRPIWLLMIPLLLPSSTLLAQNFSGLEGKDLTAVEDLDVVASNGVLSLLGPGRNINGRIARVLVRGDRERRLVIVVSYNGFPKGGFRATVQDQTKQAQRWLGTPHVDSDTGSGQVEITVNLDTLHVPEGTSFESTYLRLGFNKQGKSVGKEFQFLLPKKWQLAIRPENVVVNVRPTPIGRASQSDAATVNRYRLNAAGAAPPPPPPGPYRADPRVVERRPRRFLEMAAAASPDALTRPFALTAEMGNRLEVDIRPAAAGKISVDATWNEPVALALILNGPGQTGYFARQDGRSPLHLEFDLSAELLAKGEGWRVSVVDFSGSPANGTVRVNYPAGSGTFTSSIIATRVLIPQKILMQPGAVFTAGLTAGQRDSGLSGPSNETIDLLESLRTDVNFDMRHVAEILGVSSQVYRDRNATAGTFYFLPRAYHVMWDPSGHFGMSILYRTDPSGADSAKVQMSTHLSASIGTSDLSIAALLLQAYVRKHNLNFSELRLVRMPLDTTPRLSFADDLHHLYDIPGDRVVIREISDALAEARVDWVTDKNTATDMQTELVSHGLSGQAVLDPQGQVISSRSVPVDISLRDPGTYGLLAWRRGDIWRNETHYPITVKRLHALMLDVPDGVPTVLSWSLGDSVVQPQARLLVDTTVVPQWVDSLSLRTWVEYTVAQNCEACDRLSLADIRGGASFSERQIITFRTLTPLADIGASALTVEVRSRYLRPDATTLQDAPPLILSLDSHEFPGSSIFPPAVVDTTAAPQPSFEYRITVVMRDGTEHAGATWIPSTRTNVFIGTAQIQQSLGFLPGPPGPHN
ncbi:MAG TPA: hypothetical protein VEK77_14390 [Gemmatimonadales bacterium]|nr:hypothetical protein [Gemmatimonadales bacterium]